MLILVVDKVVPCRIEKEDLMGSRGGGIYIGAGTLIVIIILLIILL